MQFFLLSARVPKDRIYPVLVTQARYVAPDIFGVSKSRVGMVKLVMFYVGPFSLIIEEPTGYIWSGLER